MSLVAFRLALARSRHILNSCSWSLCQYCLSLSKGYLGHVISCLSTRSRSLKAYFKLSLMEFVSILPELVEGHKLAFV